MRQDFLIKHYPAVILVLFVAACSSTVKAPVSSPAGGSDGSVSTRSSGRPAYHTVVKGDTLYSIAWRYGMDFKDVAAWNSIKSPYVIYPRQKIRLNAPHRSRQTAGANSRDSQRTRDTLQKRTETTAPKKTQKITPDRNIYWGWPTAGKIVTLNLPTSENGLNISGNIGQEVKAAASGEVVYSGSGLLGYGKLIIIKHNETYLSAYAHNDRILIKEGMKVTIGQKIATMGIGNNGKPLLHFEIRKNGKPVDPRKYLPTHRS